jgi:N utilization substance protein A
MAVDLNRVIEQVSKEKGIDKAIVVSAVEEMMHSAARRTFGAERNIESRFNADLGEVELFEIKTVVEKAANTGSEVELEDAHTRYDPEAQVGDEILIKLDTATMGRIAAQAAKQNLIQHIRDAERKQIYNEFKDRTEEVVSGIVQRFERKNMIVNLGRTEAILPEKEQIPHERYRQGDRIRAIILERASPSFSRAPQTSSSLSCSSRRCPRCMRVSSRSGSARANRAAAPRWRSIPRTATSIQWALALG